MQKRVLWLEFALLCILVPGSIIYGHYGRMMFAFLWGATAYCAVVLFWRHKPSQSELWGLQAVNWTNLKPILLRWIIASFCMVVFLWWYEPSLLFNLWNRNPQIIPFLLLAYPLLSALPQEFIFCSFFFTRYKPLFGDGRLIILMSTLTFAYAHVLYINPIAPTLSLLGGLIFAQTYAKHRSLALVTIEHALYGNSLFIIGLGRYFYSGGIPG